MTFLRTLQQTNAKMSTLNVTEIDSAVSADQWSGDATRSNVLDVEGLRNRCMGNVVLMQRVLTKFQERFPEDLEDMESALNRGDIERVARVAHRVKGSAASVAALGVMQATSEIEDAGRSGRATEVSERIDLLHNAWAEYLDYAPAVIASLGNV